MSKTKTTKAEAPKKKKDAAPAKPEKKAPRAFKMELEVALTDAETSALGKSMAEVHAGIEALTAKKKDLTSQIGAEITTERGRLKELADSISRKREKRLVDVVEEFDYRTGTVRILRSDMKGKDAIVKERSMNADERQGTLPGVEVPPAPLPKEAVTTAEKPKGKRPTKGDRKVDTGPTEIDDPQALLAGVKDEPQKKGKKR